MIIAIDASRANKLQKTGVEYYSWRLINEIKKITPDDIRVVLYSQNKLHDKLADLPKNWSSKILLWPPKYFWTQLCLWLEIVMNPPDVFFVPAHTIPFLPIPKKVKIIVTVHDVGFKRYPKLYKKIQYLYHHLIMLKIKKRADKIITISKFSKQEIINLYGIDKSKIEIVYLATDQSDLTILPKPEYDKYLLYIGRIERKKNVLNMVKAFDLIKDKYPKMKFLLAGSYGNQINEIEKYIKQKDMEDRVKLLGYIEKNHLKSLLKNSTVFIFPTLYEGFGMPILDAMNFGVPVVTSVGNPHQEIGGDAAIYVDPYLPDRISVGILKLLNSDELRKKMSEKGKIQATKFKWKETAEKTIDILVN